MTEAVPARVRWRRLPLAARIAIGGLSVLVAFNLLLAAVDLATGGPPPSGPPSSSYATGPDGLAAYADLLAGNGHQVRRLRVTLDRARLGSGDTLVVADPDSLSPAEARSLRRFVDDGGRLVAAGNAVVPALRHVLGEAPVWVASGDRSAVPLVPVAEVENVSLVRSAAAGSWEWAGASLPVLAGDGASDAGAGRVLATVASAGSGRVVALADASVLHNALLGDADNAAFALAAAGEPGRPVVFAEAAHGYAESEGLAAIPGRWRWALLLSLGATLLWMWSRGRRLGPPEDLERPRPPPRRAYVDAMAASLARTKQPARCVQPLQGAARRRLARRAGLPADSGDEDLRLAATRLGMPADDIAAILAPPRDDRDLLAAGRAVAGVPGMADQEGPRW